jgi:hypothetical protein
MLRRLAPALLPLLLVVTARGDDDGADVASPSASGSASAAPSESGCEIANGVDTAKDSEVHLSLAEFSITAEEDSAGAGVVQVEATNDGAVDHEVVIVKGTKGDLPLKDGAVDEDALGDDLVGEIEPFAAGDECIGKFEMDAGTYTLFCGIVEESGESHFAEGMVTQLEVK